MKKQKKNTSFIEDHILRATGAGSIISSESVQELWSGYGSLKRYYLNSGRYSTIIVKHISIPSGNTRNHPRGWAGELSHKRKIKSYQAELNWYGNYSQMCNDSCRIPHYIDSKIHGSEILLLLEDLDAAGFTEQTEYADWPEVATGLSWLANFHAQFTGKEPKGIWKTGTYWHLDTRPDELKALNDIALKNAAGKIDLLLKKAEFQTFVHGDAKLANFKFTSERNGVAAVDFQYVGGGCGMKDVAYFIGSCFSESQCEALESQILDHYFKELEKALKRTGFSRTAELIQEWETLYHVAWADFHRFLKGWSPGHWKINSYSEKVTAGVIEKLIPV